MLFVEYGWKFARALIQWLKKRVGEKPSGRQFNNPAGKLELWCYLESMDENSRLRQISD